MEFGLFDALRQHHEEDGIYTWWDLRQGAFHRDWGMRIDHFLVSGPALDASIDVAVDRERFERGDRVVVSLDRAEVAAGAEVVVEAEEGAP